MDDGYAIAKPELVFPKVREFARRVKARCGLEFETEKFLCFVPPGAGEVELPPGCVRGGEEIDGQWEAGFKVVGVPVGTRAFVHKCLVRKVAEVGDELVRAVSGSTRGSVAAGWSGEEGLKTLTGDEGREEQD